MSYLAFSPFFREKRENEIWKKKEPYRASQSLIEASFNSSYDTRKNEMEARSQEGNWQEKIGRAWEKEKKKEGKSLPVMLGKTIIIMGKSILHKTWKREQFREKWRDGERMRGFALLRTNEFDLWHIGFSKSQLWEMVLTQNVRYSYGYDVYSEHFWSHFPKLMPTLGKSPKLPSSLGKPIGSIILKAGSNNREDKLCVKRITKDDVKRRP